MNILEVQNLTHKYSKGSMLQTTAIDDVSLTVKRGECIGIIGHTGSGKSTLIQHLNGLLKPDSGTVLLDGKDIWESKQTMRQARFRVGLCFQYPEYQLFEETVYRDIAFGPKNMQLAEAEIKRRVLQAAQYVGLGEELLEKSPFDLSGGEKRRAAIAGVMAMEPEVLVLDEPTSGLDPRGRQKILERIRTYQKETGGTVLLVSHSMDEVADMADRVLVLNQGRIAMFDTVDAVFSHDSDLESIGLKLPEVTAIFHALREAGLDVSPNVYTVAQGVNEYLRLMGKGDPQ